MSTQPTPPVAARNVRAAPRAFAGTGWPAAFRKAKWPTHYLAVTSMSGPGEAWYLTGHESYAAIETDNRNVEKTPALSKELERLSQVDGELLSGTRGLLATYRTDLSYRPDIDIAQMRYFALTIITLKPGYDSAFADVRKVVNAGHDNAKMDEHWAMYQVTSGMAGNTYLLFIPMKSLQEADVAQESHGKPYQDALAKRGGNSSGTLPATARRPARRSSSPSARR